MDDLEYILREFKPYISPGITYAERLNAITLPRIIELMGVGYPLKTRPKAPESGILNQLNIPEHVFWAWVLKQPQDLQEELEFVSRVVYNNKKNELIDKTIETTDQFDDLIAMVNDEKIGTEEAKDVAAILDKKQNAATKALGQLTKIDQVEQGSNKGTTPEVMEIHVHTGENHDARIEKLKRLRKDD